MKESAEVYFLLIRFQIEKAAGLAHALQENATPERTAAQGSSLYMIGNPSFAASSAPTFFMSEVDLYHLDGWKAHLSAYADLLMSLADTDGAGTRQRLLY